MRRFTRLASLLENKRVATFTRFATGECERWLTDLLALNPGEELLDMGCATGTLAVPLARAGTASTAATSPRPCSQSSIKRTAAETPPITSHLMAWEDDWEASGLG